MRKPFCINPECANFLPEDKRGWKKKETAEEGEDSGKKKTAAPKTAVRKTAAAKKTSTATKSTATKPAARKTAAKKTAGKKAYRKGFRPRGGE